MLWFLLVFGIAVWAFDGHTIAKNTIVTKYRKFREVNRLVETKYKTIGMILWVSIQMICKMYWLNVLAWLNTSVRHVDKRRIEVSYVLNGKLYKVITSIHRGPCSILLISDENSEDITEEILPFFGPNEDWHKQEFTPEFWNRKTLNFELSSGEHKTFEEKQVINLN
jgi:hypothetical protein